jgi:hypothetical protein
MSCAIEPRSYLPKNYKFISGVLILMSLLLKHSYLISRTWGGVYNLLKMSNVKHSACPLYGFSEMLRILNACKPPQKRDIRIFPS